MSKIIHIIGAADGRTPTPHDGRYVVEWNPHTHAGTLAIDSTDDIRKARRFADGGEAFEEWRTVSSVQARRPWDERPNRPLTAVTVEILEAPDVSST